MNVQSVEENRSELMRHWGQSLGEVEERAVEEELEEERERQLEGPSDVFSPFDVFLQEKDRSIVVSTQTLVFNELLRVKGSAVRRRLRVAFVA